jgi:hypothetical protein
MMLPPLQARFETLERQRREVLSGLALWPEDRLVRRTREGTWSALEIVDHLIRVEHASLERMPGVMCEKVPVTFREHVGAFAVRCVMLSPLRIKVPGNASSTLPVSPGSLPQVDAEWQRVRSELKVFLEGCSPAQLACAAIRHPVSGSLTLGQTLAFLSAHLRHHTYQLGRLKRTA